MGFLLCSCEVQRRIYKAKLDSLKELCKENGGIALVTPWVEEGKDKSSVVCKNGMSSVKQSDYNYPSQDTLSVDLPSFKDYLQVEDINKCEEACLNNQYINYIETNLSTRPYKLTSVDCVCNNGLILKIQR